MKRARLFFLKLWPFVALLATQQAMAMSEQDCTLASVSQRLINQPVLNQFEQTKRIAILSKPLLSQGYLLVNHQQGLVWQTTKPLKSTLVIADNHLQQFNQQEQPVSVPLNANHKTSQLIAATFLAILQGDFSRLEDNFASKLHCDKQRWNMQLEAAQPEMQRLLKSITIIGNNRIEQLLFTDANGDTSELTFSPLVDQALQQSLGQYFVP